LPQSIQRILNDRLVDERHRLLRQVETLDRRAVGPEPFYIRREADHFLIHLHAANAGAATQSRVKNLNDGH
jgi:hypothetical protein